LPSQVVGVQAPQNLYISDHVFGLLIFFGRTPEVLDRYYKIRIITDYHAISLCSADRPLRFIIEKKVFFSKTSAVKHILNICLL